MRIKDPVRSEQGMFEALIWVVAIVAVLVVLVLVLRALL
jgi:CHASE3 domain sensor protein